MQSYHSKRISIINGINIIYEFEIYYNITNVMFALLLCATAPRSKYKFKLKIVNKNEIKRLTIRIKSTHMSARTDAVRACVGLAADTKRTRPHTAHTEKKV